MRSFNKLKVTSVFIFVFIILHLVCVFNFNRSLKSIDNPEKIEWVVIGNSHAYKIIINDDKVYYLNEDGADIDRRVKQIHIAMTEFKNAKYFIINITPLEMYKPINMLARDNDLLNAVKPIDFVSFFENNLVKSPLSIFKASSNSIYFLSNGRKVSIGGHGYIDRDWLRESHFSGEKPSLVYFFTKKDMLEKMISSLKKSKDAKIILISMPLHYLYISRVKSYLSKNNLPDLNSFNVDMKNLGSDCYINLYDYPLPNEMFFNGDHLNERGSVFMRSEINKKIMTCVSSE